MDGEFPPHVRGSGSSRGKAESPRLTSQMASGHERPWSGVSAHRSPLCDDPLGSEEPDEGAHTDSPGRTVAS